MSREQFEKLHPVPEGVSWSDVLDMYACEFLAYQNAEKRQNALWQGFQAGHAAGLEAAAKFLDEWNTAIGDDLAKSIRAMKEPK